MSKKDIIALPSTGEMTSTSWTLPQQLEQPEWKEAAYQLEHVNGAINWWVGDWWNYGERKFGDIKKTIESDDWRGPGYHTSKIAAIVCRKFEKVRRRTQLSFHIHQEVAPLPMADADELLDWCESVLRATGAPPTRNQIRERVKQKQYEKMTEWTDDQLERKQQIENGFAVVASQARLNGSNAMRDAALIAWANQEEIAVDITRNSIWGNPFILPDDGTRRQVCSHYAKHYLPYKKRLQGLLHTLQGKVLICWCYPEQCHGDILREQANKIYLEESK